MKRQRHLLAFSLVAGCSLSCGASAQILDVMLVFSDDSGLSSFEKTAVAGEVQLVLSATYSLQLDGNAQVEVCPLLVP
jgi:hypothetical protein